MTTRRAVMRARFVPSGPARQVHAPVLDTLHAAGARTVVTPQGSGSDTFVAERKHRQSFDLSCVRTHAQPTRGHWMPSVPSLVNTARCELPSTTALHTVRARNIGPASESLTAAGVQMPEYCVRTSRAESPVPYTRRPCDHEFHLAVTFMTETVSTSIEGRLQTPPANCRL